MINLKNPIPWTHMMCTTLKQQEVAMKNATKDQARFAYFECLEYSHRAEKLRREVSQAKTLSSSRKKIEKTVNQFKYDILNQELHTNLDAMLD
jgi:uncharacterized protein YlxW (UPF0749 family)